MKILSAVTFAFVTIQPPSVAVAHDITSTTQTTKIGAASARPTRCMIEGSSVVVVAVLSRLPSIAAAMPEIPPAAATSGFAALEILSNRY